MDAPVKPADAGASTDNTGAMEPAEAAFVEIRRTHRAFDRAVCEIIGKYDLSDTQFSALRALRDAGADGIPSGEIANRMSSRVPDITRLVDRLIGAGLAERKPCHADRRVVWVKLSAKGRALLKRIEAPIRKLNAEQFSALSEKQLRTLARLLRKARSGGSA